MRFHNGLLVIPKMKRMREMEDMVALRTLGIIRAISNENTYDMDITSLGMYGVEARNVNPGFTGIYVGLHACTEYHVGDEGLGPPTSTV